MSVFLVVDELETQVKAQQETIQRLEATTETLAKDVARLEKISSILVHELTIISREKLLEAKQKFQYDSSGNIDFKWRD